MLRPRILLPERAVTTTEALRALHDMAHVVAGDFDRDRLLDEVPRAEVLWTGLRHSIDAEVLEAGRSLRCIVSPTTGLTHIDAPGAATRGIPVLSLHGADALLRDVRATAEHTVGLMLAMLRAIPAATRSAAGGRWEREPFLGSELYRRRVAIIGYGRIGRIVARYLAAFGSEVRAVDVVTTVDADGATPLFASLEDALQWADVITVHVSLNRGSTGLLGARELGMVRRGSYLVNTSRGEVLDEQALIDALESGRLAGAALDVMSGEQQLALRRSRLCEYARQNPRLLITPHIGGFTAESRLKTDMYMVDQLRGFLERAAIESRTMDRAAALA